MKYCPKCYAEYIDDVTACEDCAVDLIDQQQWEVLLKKRRAEDDELFVKVVVIENQFEADVLKDALEKDRIPVIIKPFTDTSFNGIYTAQKGWGSLQVPVEYRDRARVLIESIEQDMQSKPEPPEDR